MNKALNLVGFGAFLLLALAGNAFAANQAYKGYNYNANIFVGTGTQWCTESGYPTSWCTSFLGASANDLVIMKWNNQWNTCNAAGEANATACAGAWENNEWIGTVPGGDGSVWHYKIIWAPEGSQYWLPGGESVWGNYEIIMDQGTEQVDSTMMHVINAIATPAGYGVAK
ncbi:MAG: hypothetical protein ACP5RP_03575 [Candidatus Micrarchaeia archaeon]